MPQEPLTGYSQPRFFQRPAGIRHITPVLLVGLAILLIIGGSVSAQEVEQAGVELAEISPYLEAELASSDEDVSFLVVLKDQFDPEALTEHLADVDTTDREARLAATYSALTEHAVRTQASLRSWLDDRNVNDRPFYIVNMIEVVGDGDLAAALRQHPDVDQLIGNPQLRQAHLLAPSAPTLPSWLKTVNAADAAQTNELPYGLRATNANDVWALGYTGDGIVVASQDTGVEWDHPALQPRYRGWDEAEKSGTHTYNWFDAWGVAGRPSRCEASAAIPCDDHGRGHGTHTVGTMLGNETDGHTQVGMAPDAQWIGCRNMRNGVGTPASYITCFEFFLAPYPQGGDPATDGQPEEAPHIVNNSWACPPSEGCDTDTLRQVVEIARAAGIFVISSVGNEGWGGCSTVQNPIAIYDASFSVGAYDANGNIAGFSSRGPVTIDGSGRLKPDVSAPGVATQSTTINGGYTALSGTSMASPHVAGASALLWSAVPELIGDIEMTEQAIIKGASPVPVSLCNDDSANLSSNPVSPNPIFGYGRLDALAAVELALHPADVAVQVQTTAGQPVADVMVSLTDEMTGYRREGLADASGSVAFDGVLAGDYEVEVWQGSEIIARRFFRAEADGEYDLRLLAAAYKLFWPDMAQAP